MANLLSGLWSIVSSFWASTFSSVKWSQQEVGYSLRDQPGHCFWSQRWGHLNPEQSQRSCLCPIGHIHERGLLLLSPTLPIVSVSAWAKGLLGAGPSCLQCSAYCRGFSLLTHMGSQWDNPSAPPKGTCRTQLPTWGPHVSSQPLPDTLTILSVFSHLTCFSGNLMLPPRSLKWRSHFGGLSYHGPHSE